jgi:hypothetical protein
MHSVSYANKSRRLGELREQVASTKISVIADEQNNIISMDYDKTHLSAKNKPAFCHDLKLVQKNLNNMHIKIQKEKITKLCGDKGYIREWNIKE